MIKDRGLIDQNKTSWAINEFSFKPINAGNLQSTNEMYIDHHGMKCHSRSNVTKLNLSIE